MPRLIGVDVARGLALLGMMATHVFATFTDDGAVSGVTLVAAGRSTLGLAVTVGNPAQRLYVGLGFVPLQDVRQVVVPSNVG